MKTITPNSSSKNTASLPDDATVLSRKMVPPWHVLIASILAGPLACGLMLARNEMALKEKSQARTYLIFSTLHMIALVVLVHYVSRDFARTAGFATVAYYVVASKMQGEAYAQHMAKGGKKSPLWQSLVFMLAGLAIMMGTGLGISLLMEQFNWRY